MTNDLIIGDFISCYVFETLQKKIQNKRFYNVDKIILLVCITANVAHCSEEMVCRCHPGAEQRQEAVAWEGCRFKKESERF